MRSFLQSDASNAHEVLERLLKSEPKKTSEAPKDSRGIYGLIDHRGDLRYIGSTSAENETFHRRIHHRHRSGSETHSHYFSRMYNTGRMWRLRNDDATKSDGDIAKKLRNAFIAEYCRAVWVPLPDNANILALENEILSLAPPETVAWNRRGMSVYQEPKDLVDIMIEKLGFGAWERAALDRQNRRFLGTASKPPYIGRETGRPPSPPLPRGSFRFAALDVETANNDRGSICQIGIAFVGQDNAIETWKTYVDPQTDRWLFSGLHGITNALVSGAPTFEELLPALETALKGLTVYQHSGFDRSAIRSACSTIGRAEPSWDWQDSVVVARKAWPELKGNGGHGLASLQQYLGLSFDHHDAGEDARAAAEIVLRAESRDTYSSHTRKQTDRTRDGNARDSVAVVQRNMSDASVHDDEAATSSRLLGQIQLTAGNIRNNHIYLRDLWHLFPADCIGGSNAASAASRQVRIDWGGASPEMTDLDGTKKLFRKRSWVRKFFEMNGVCEGDSVYLYSDSPYAYRLRIQAD